MINYRNCTDAEFEQAMDIARKVKYGELDVKDVDAEMLFIAYTKLEADAGQLRRVGTSYAMGLQAASERRAKLMKLELVSRGLLVS